MFASVWGASMCHNDLGILNMSGLTDYLEDILKSVDPNDLSKIPKIYADAIFNDCLTISTRIDDPQTDAEKAYNERMNSARQSIEHHFGMMFNLFRLLTNKSKHKLLKSRKDTYALGLVGFFLLNCYTCFNGSIVTERFGMKIPQIEEYLPLDEELDVEEDYFQFDNNEDDE